MIVRPNANGFLSSSFPSISTFCGRSKLGRARKKVAHAEKSSGCLLVQVLLSEIVQVFVSAVFRFIEVDRLVLSQADYSGRFAGFCTSLGVRL